MSDDEFRQLLLDNNLNKAIEIAKEKGYDIGTKLLYNSTYLNDINIMGEGKWVINNPKNIEFVSLCKYDSNINNGFDTIFDSEGWTTIVKD